MRPVTDLMWKALVDTYDALVGWFAGLSIDPTAWSGFTWLIVAGLGLLLLTLLLRPRRPWKERRPELLISHGEVALRDPEAHKAVTFAASAPAHAPFELRMTVSNLGSTPIQLLELSVLTNGAQAPNSAEVGAVVPPHGAVDVAAEVHEMAGDEGRIDLFVYVPNMRPKTFRLRARLRWEPWNARFRLVPLEQRIDKARGLASSARYRREATAWRRGLAKERAALGEADGGEAATISGRQFEPTWAEAPSFVPSAETARPRAERSAFERPAASLAEQRADVETADRIPAAAPRSATRPRPTLAPETHRRTAARPQRDPGGAGPREIEPKPTGFTPVPAEPSSLERGRVDPARVDPARVDPVRADPMRAGPMRTAPIRIEPTQASSGYDAPIHDAPIRDEPIRDERIRDEQIRDEPIRTEPAYGAPVRSEPVGSEPRFYEPRTYEPHTNEPHTNEPHTNEPHTNEPAALERVRDEPATAEPIRSQPIRSLPGRLGRLRGAEPAASSEDASSIPGAPMREATQAERSSSAPPARPASEGRTGAQLGPWRPGERRDGRTTARDSSEAPLAALSAVTKRLLNARRALGSEGADDEPAEGSGRADDQASSSTAMPTSAPTRPTSMPAEPKPMAAEPTGPAAPASGSSDAEPARPRLEFPDDFD